MLSNLLQSFSRVQQLLVRVIFPPGISDSSKPISLTFSSRKSLSLRMGKREVSEELPRTPRRPDLPRQQALRRRPGLDRAYAAQPPKRDHRAPPIKTLCVWRVRVAFADQSPSGKNPHSKCRAEGRDLRGQDVMFVCYSCQEYHADEKLLDTLSESGYVCVINVVRSGKDVMAEEEEEEYVMEEE